MKTTLSFFLLLACGIGTGFADQTANTPLPAPTSYQVVSEGANHRIWQRQTFERAMDGTIVAKIHQFTELATGLNYQNSQGQWVPSQETIEASSQGAVARQGQYQVVFANNLNTAASIEMRTPDGKDLKSNILGLGYYDSSTGEAVLIAQVKDSAGQLVGNNQVLYSDAFDGVGADVQYTYRRGQFEQDVILRAQPPSPDSYGMNPATTTLEVFTEFVDPPQETVTVEADGNGAAADESISWGATLLGHGKAFELSGQEQSGGTAVSVQKKYVTIQGRKVLIEIVPLRAIANDLKQLPDQSSISKPRNTLLAKSEAAIIPKPLKKTASAKPMKLAALQPPKKGYVLDYVTLSPSWTNFAFRGDATYLVSGDVNLAGVTTIEGGAVIKMDTNSAVAINVLGTVNCKTGPYSPAVFTTADDGTVGEGTPSSGSVYSPPCSGAFNLKVQNNWGEDLQFVTIHDASWNLIVDGEGWPEITSGNFNTYSFTAGLGEDYYLDSYDGDWNEFWGDFNPTLTNGLIVIGSDGSFNYSETGGDLCTPPPPPPPPNSVGLSLAQGGVLGNLRFKSFNLGIDTLSNTVVADVQFINCDTAIKTEGASLYAGNILMANCGIGFAGSSFAVWAENMTYDQGSNVTYSTSGTSSLYMTNSLITAVSAWGNASYHTNYTAWLSSNSGVYQSVGAGSYYLPTNSPYRNSGTYYIVPWLLADLQQKTTYPPAAYAGVSLTNTTYSPQVQRDSDTPDLGYHYDPLDYCFSGCSAPTNLTFTAGTAIGWYESGGYYGIGLGYGITVNFTGTALAPCVLARYSTVQDQYNGNWGTKGGMGAICPEGHADNNMAGAGRANLQFAKFYGLAADPNYFRDDDCWIIVRAKHSEFHGGQSDGYGIQFWVTNCLFECSGMGLQSTDTGNGVIAIQNCTMRRGYILAQHWSGATWPVIVKNSSFDSADPGQMDGASANTSFCIYSNNAYIAGLPGLPVTNMTDKVVTNFNWQSSWFGNYYLPPASPLIDAGTVTADLVGLYHFTSQTNQIVEGTSAVDIGYHYVATDSYGNPLDTDGDGIADYLEDSNGNGIFDAGDLGDWLTGPYNSISRTNGLSVFTPLK